MVARVAEHLIRHGIVAGTTRYRVDLHGVSVFGPAGEHSLVRWEWVQEITAGEGVTVRSASSEITLPSGAFGLDPEVLAERLGDACGIDRRVEIIAALAGGRRGG